MMQAFLSRRSFLRCCALGGVGILALGGIDHPAYADSSDERRQMLDTIASRYMPGEILSDSDAQYVLENVMCYQSEGVSTRAFVGETIPFDVDINATKTVDGIPYRLFGNYYFKALGGIGYTYEFGGSLNAGSTYIGFYEIVITIHVACYGLVVDDGKVSVVYEGEKSATSRSNPDLTVTDWFSCNLAEQTDGLYECVYLDSYIRSDMTNTNGWTITVYDSDNS